MRMTVAPVVPINVTKSIYLLQVAACAAFFHEIFLVVFFCRPKGWCGDDLGSDRVAKAALCVELFFCLLSGFLLGLIVEENNRSVLRSNVRSLAVIGRWIVVFPENFQQFLITDLFRVKNHVYHFSVICCTAADILIGWLVLVATGITNAGFQNTWGLAKQLFHPPKASCAKHCIFCL